MLAENYFLKSGKLSNEANSFPLYAQCSLKPFIDRQGLLLNHRFPAQVFGFPHGSLWQAGLPEVAIWFAYCWERFLAHFLSTNLSWFGYLTLSHFDCI